MPADPLGALRWAIDFATPPLTPKPASVWVGGYEGTPATPYAQIRSRGGPRPANWQPEAMRRVDLFCYGKTYAEADDLSTAIDTFLRELYNYERIAGAHRTRIQFVNTESDGIDGIDDDTNLPFMFRSYIIAYQEI